MKTVQNGDNRLDTPLLQVLLNIHSQPLPKLKLKVYRDFGPKTEQTVRDFQK